MQAIEEGPVLARLQFAPRCIFSKSPCNEGQRNGQTAAYAAVLRNARQRAIGDVS